MSAFSREHLDRIRSTASELVEEHQMPGLALGVVSGQAPVLAEGYGYADIESRRPQSPSLRHRIGSVSKLMVGLCAMALVDEGRLSLEDRVIEKLPDIRMNGAAESVTVQHLLTHTGGIGDAPTMGDYLDPWPMLFSDDPEIPAVREAYPKGITVEVEPGTKWSYANHGFALLGEIIAREEGAPIEEVVRQRVFDPLGMTSTDSLDRPHPDLTTGYHLAPQHDDLELNDLLGKDSPREDPVDGHNIRGHHQYVVPRAAGAVESTVTDMVRFASALLREGAGIVRPATFATMTSAQWCPDDRLFSLGLVFMRQRRFGRATFGHYGTIFGGWQTAFTVFPDDDLAVIVFSNRAVDPDFLRIESRLVQAVLDAPDQVPTGGATSPRLLESAAGVYEFTSGHLTNFRNTRAIGRVQITVRDGELWLRTRRGPWREGLRMIPDASGLFALDTGDPEPPHVSLVLDSHWQVAELRFDRLVHMVKTESLSPWA
jgi:CubicO group peptidase (beta-lactamase class C family)